MPFFHDMFKAPYTSLQELNLDWLLTKVKNILRFVPDDGYVGQILRRTSSGAEWSDEQGGGGAVSSVNGQTGAVVLTASDVGALPDSYTAPVDSVNGQTGAVVLGKSDIGLGNVDNVQQYSASNPPPYPVTSVNSKTGAVVIDKTDVGLGNVSNVAQYSASNPPPYPVTSVNGQTGAVVVADANISANGYCKMPDGTLICWGEFQVLNATQWSNPSAYGAMYSCNATNLGISYAYPFLANSSVSCVINTKDQALAILLADSDYSGISRIFVLRHVNAKPPDTTFSYIATGRWKA